MKITCIKNDKGYNLIAENGKSMQISENTRDKLGDIDDFVKCVTRYGYDSDQVVEYLRSNAEDGQFGITYINYFFQIAKFIYENNNDIVDFSYLHLVNTELDYVIEYDKKRPIKFKEVPVYYRRFYEPIKREKEEWTQENEMLRYKYKEAVYALKLKINEPYSKKHKHFEGYLQAKKDLEDVLSTNRKIMIVTIPSSKVVNKDKITLNYLVKDLAKDNDNLIDGTKVFERIKDKSTSHTTQDRSIIENIKTLEVHKVKCAEHAEAIVVLDDITTSGHSFISVDKMLESKYNLPIINIAYGKTVHSFYNSMSFEGRRTNSMINAIITDVDNTIVRKLYSKEYEEKDSKRANRQREELIKKDKESMEMLKYFSMLSKIHTLKIGFISNRDQRTLDNIMYNIFNTQNHILPVEYIQKNDNEYYLSSDYVQSTSIAKFETYPKPSSYIIKKMLKKLDVKAHDRVIGIGNQESDMIAYKNAGIEPVLLNWFNEDLEEYNKIPAVDYNQYGLVFNDPKEFEKWLLNNIEKIEF